MIGKATGPFAVVIKCRHLHHPERPTVELFADEDSALRYLRNLEKFGCSAGRDGCLGEPGHTLYRIRLDERIAA